MRKSLFFWFSVLIAAGIIGGAVFLFGKTPDKVIYVTKAIPLIDVESPYLFLVLEAGQIEPDLPDLLVKRTDAGSEPILAVIEDLMPLFSFAKQSAAVIVWHDNEIVFYGCFLLAKEMMADMKAGKLPVAWLEQSSGLALVPSETEGLLDLSAGGGKFVFKVKTEGDLLMVALSPEGIKQMSRTLAGEDKHMDPVFTVERSWPAHLRLFDDCLLSQAASVRGIPVPDVPISGEIAWNSKGESGELAWNLNGLREWVPEKVRSKLSPHEWNERIHLPDPLITAVGISVPEGLEELAKDDLVIPGWVTDSGLDRDSLARLLAGPLMFTLGGQSRILLFDLPGVLLQLPGRGLDGINWIEGFWGGKWAGFALTPKPLEGFAVGGSLAIPLSVVAAAREDLAIAGVITRSSLGGILPVKEIVPLGEEKALFWLYADFPKAAEALEHIARFGSLSERFGEGSLSPEEVLATALELRALGKVSIVIQDLESGRGEWENAVLSEE